MTGKYRSSVYGIVFLYTMVILLNTNCFHRQRMFKETFFTMDTYITIKIVSGSRNTAMKVLKKVASEADRLHVLLNAHIDGSEVTRINRVGESRKRFAVNPEVSRIIAMAQGVSEQTNGTFDITIRPVKRLWGFENKLKRRVPLKREIDSVLLFVGFRKLLVDTADNTVLFKKKGLQIDLGGIAKGYALRRFSEIILKAGIGSFLIDAGGDVYAAGTKPNGEKWKVGLRHPRKEGQLAAVLTLDSSMAVVTSGDYERFFIKDGKRYNHIFNSKTGYPANKCISVTIITKDPVMADALSTAVFVMGSEGMDYINGRDGTEGIIITEDKDGKRKYLVSRGLAGKIRITD